MPKSKKPERAIGRRGFLTGVATAAAGAAALTRIPGAGADAEAAQRGESNAPAPPPSPAQVDRDAGSVRPPARPTARRARRRASRIGPDGSGPEGSRHRICRRESGIELRRAAGVAHQLRQSAEQDAGVHHRAARRVRGDDGARLRQGEGKPMCALLHGTIGIQHAAMSIYQAYYDRTPVLLIAGRDRRLHRRAHARTTWPAWCAASRSGTRSRRRWKNR